MRQQTPWILLFLCTFTLASNNVRYQQYKTPHDVLYDEVFEEFCKPVRFTQTHIRHFLSDVYSHHRYAKDYLPHNFSHFIQFLQQGKLHNQNGVYMESTIRLFANKLKSSRYVSAYAFGDMLTYLPNLLTDYCLTCDTSSMIEQAATSVKDLLYRCFVEKFSFFKANPDDFITDLSKEIATSLNDANAIRAHVEKEELRQTLIRFLEIGLMKLIWSPDDQELTWESVKKIADELTQLHNADIITQDELDDLFKSLLESYCHFLELAGSELSIQVLNAIKDDITDNSLLLFCLAEQEDFIASRSDRLRFALIETEAKIRARHHGIITEKIVT